MGRLVLRDGETFGTLGAFSTTDVIGTNASQTVILDRIADVTFDASFNRGGDVIVLGGEASEYFGQIVGSNLVITSDLGTNVVLPFGVAGTTVTFSDGSTSLRVEGQSVRLGDQTLTTEALQLSDAVPTAAAGAPAPAEALAAPVAGDDIMLAASLMM